MQVPSMAGLQVAPPSTDRAYTMRYRAGLPSRQVAWITPASLTAMALPQPAGPMTDGPGVAATRVSEVVDALTGGFIMGKGGRPASPHPIASRSSPRMRLFRLLLGVSRLCGGARGALRHR